MSTRWWSLLCGVVVCIAIASHVVSPSLAQQEGDRGKPAAPAASDADREVSIRYAQAHLKLMEARVAELEERNRRAPNTIRPAAIQLAQEYVGKSRRRLELEQGQAGNESQLYVARAEATLRAAEETLRRTVEVSKRLANSVAPGEIARLTAQRDLARARVEKARHLASASPLANLRYEIDELREDVQELQLLEAMSRRGS